MTRAAHISGSARERLLLAADELFYADGILTTGVDVVVARAQVAVASLYNLFRNKDGLVVAYLEARDQRWHATWEVEIARHEDPGQRLLAIFDALLTWAVDERLTRGCAMVAATAELGGDPAHPAVGVVAAHRAAIRSRMAELAAATGRPDHRQRAADLVVLYEGLLACSAQDGPRIFARGRPMAQLLLG